MPLNIVASPEVEQGLKIVRERVQTEVRLGLSWMNKCKPLGRMRAPSEHGPLPPAIQDGLTDLVVEAGVLAVEALASIPGACGYALGPKGQRGRALQQWALKNEHARHIQNEVASATLLHSLSYLPEPGRSFNLSCLDRLHKATRVAAQACQRLRQGETPPKEITRVAVGWVVVMACLVSSERVRDREGKPVMLRLNSSVKTAAIHAYPLFTAGKRLNETIGPEEALNVAFAALGVL